MLKMLERNVARAAERFVVLAPPDVDPFRSRQTSGDPERHAQLLRDLQRFRGSIYLNDGALRPEQLTVDGRHKTPEDEKSWHLLLMNPDGQIGGCIWYLEHFGTPALEQLRVRECALARKGAASLDKLRRAVSDQVDWARREDIRCAEVGGWAVGKGAKPTDCLVAVLATYALSQLNGGAVVMATATERHCSATILRRLGGDRVQIDGEPLSPYYDERYKCNMELLRFDTRRPSPRFAPMVAMLRESFANIPVITPQEHPVASFLPNWQRRPAADTTGWEPAVAH